MKKSEALLNPTSCLNKAASDEPIFILRANDPTAPQTIRLWAAMNEPKQPLEKCAGALDVADNMEKYRSAKYPPVPCAIPDAQYTKSQINY